MNKQLKIHELQGRFLSYQDIKENSRAIYKCQLQNFFLWLHRNGIELYNVKRTHVMDYRTYLQEKYESIYTVRNNFTAVRLFFEWAENSGIMDNPTPGIKQPKYDKKLNKMPLFSNQVSQLLNQIDRSTQVGKRNYAIVFLMITLGLRVGEVTSININDIEEFNGVLLLRLKGKGCDTKSQTLRVDTLLFDVLEEYLTTRNFKEYEPLFVTHERGKPSKRIGKQTIQNMIKNNLKAIGLTGRKYCSHSLRHTTATLMILNGNELSTVQGHMRHANIATTEMYLRFILEWQRLNSTVGNDIAQMINQGQENNQNEHLNTTKEQNGTLIKIINVPNNIEPSLDPKYMLHGASRSQTSAKQATGEGGRIFRKPL